MSPPLLAQPWGTQSHHPHASSRDGDTRVGNAGYYPGTAVPRVFVRSVGVVSLGEVSGHFFTQVKVPEFE